MFVKVTVVKHLKKEKRTCSNSVILLTTEELLLIYTTEMKIRSSPSTIFFLTYPA